MLTNSRTRLVRAFIKKEFVQTLRDPRMKFMLFVTPLFQLIIFGLALNSDVKNIAMYARPLANDKIFVDIKRDAMASTWFNDVQTSEKISLGDIDNFISGKVELGLFTQPGGLTQNFETDQGRLQAVIDGSDLTRARQIVGYLENIMARSIGERVGRPQLYSFEAEAQTPTYLTLKRPIEFATRILYNPELVTAYNLVPGVMCMLICIITIMLTSMSLAKEKEIGTFETLISAPVTVPEILLGKTIPYIIIGAINLPFIFLVAVVGFDVPMRGLYIWLIISTLFFLITTVSIGTLISTICRSQQQAMMGSFIFLMPSILLSGIMFPIDNMPLILRLVAKVNPVMYYTMLLRNIMLKGGDHVVVLTYTGALLLITLFCVSTAFKKFKLTLG